MGKWCPSFSSEVSPSDRRLPSPSHCASSMAVSAESLVRLDAKPSLDLQWERLFRGWELSRSKNRENRGLCLVKLGTVLVGMVRLSCCSAASDMDNRVKSGVLKPSHEKGLVSWIVTRWLPLPATLQIMLNEEEWPVQGMAALQSGSILSFRHLRVLIQKTPKIQDSSHPMRLSQEKYGVWLLGRTTRHSWGVTVWVTTQLKRTQGLAVCCRLR